jgi:hypothetical protein
VDNPSAVTASATLADLSRNLMYNHTMAGIAIANRRLVIGCVVLALAVCLGYFWWSSLATPSRDTLVALLPGDSEAAIFVDLGELQQSPFFTDLLDWAPKQDVDAEYRRFVSDTHFNYETDLQRVAVAFQEQDGQQFILAIGDGRFDQKKIQAYGTRINENQKRGEPEIFLVPAAAQRKTIFFTFLRKDRIAITNGKDFKPLLELSKSGDRDDWQTRFKRVAGSPLFAVIRNDGLKEILGNQSPANGSTPRTIGGLTSPQLSSLLEQLQWVTIAGKPENDELRTVVEGESSDDVHARQLADMVNGILVLARAGLSGAKAGSATRSSYLALLKSAQVSQIDRGETKSVRLIFSVTPQLLKSAEMAAPGGSNAPPAPNNSTPRRQAN